MSLDIMFGAVRRGRRVVLESGRITAPPAAAVGVVGINGSGKSSLFMQLTHTLSTASASSVTLAGRHATTAYVPQECALPAWLRVEQVTRMHGLDFAELVATMPGLHLHELAGSSGRTLSTGQRQALAVALALGRAAEVTLLDEPFSALDFRRRLGAIELLRQTSEAGRAFLLSSQSAADLVELCDRFVVIRDGRCVFNGARTELVDEPDGRQVEQRLLQLLT